METERERENDIHQTALSLAKLQWRELIVEYYSILREDEDDDYDDEDLKCVKEDLKRRHEEYKSLERLDRKRKR